jgi:hypothetical protein
MKHTLLTSFSEMLPSHQISAESSLALQTQSRLPARHSGASLDFFLPLTTTGINIPQTLFDECLLLLPENY